VWFAMKTDGEQIRSMLEMEDQYDFAIATPFVFFLLCGLSLELLYKALVIELGIEPPALHNLRKLAQLGSLTLDDADLELMDLLSIHVVWAGKYPVPRRGEVEYDEAVRLTNKALMDRVPGMSIPIMRRNERLKWPDYPRIWRIGEIECWKRYHLRNEVGVARLCAGKVRG